MKSPSSLHALLICTTLLIGTATHAQLRPSIGVLNIEGRGVIPDATALGSMVRIELDKTGRYEVLDWHDEQEVLARNNIAVAQCYGKTCVLEAGRVLKADKMVLGGVERFNERIAISLKIVDVATGEVERSNASEYQNAQPEMQRMIEVSVKRLLGIEPEKVLTDNLDAYNGPIESPVAKANLSGPRFGLYYVDGDAGTRLRGELEYGGYHMSTVTSMIGWQQEIQYVNAGDFQCLFEFLFTGSGLESGRFIPAITFMNGFRMNKSGWEFAFGPTFRFVRKADGFYTGYDVEKDWHLESEWSSYFDTKPDMLSNLDSRGDVSLTAGLVIGVGKTFRSGQLNIPVNFYMIPRQEGATYGLSLGFNVFHSRN